MSEGSGPRSGGGTTGGAALDFTRVGELADDLLRTVELGRRQLQEEKQKLVLEFEASRVQLHTEYSQRLLQADAELCAVQEERSSRREASTVNLHEIVNLNVGGKVYTVKRETLCVCRGSFLAELFSGRWDPKLQKDAAGHFFLDVDPDVFDIILAWLRDCKIESPTRPASSPTVPAEHMQHFQAAVDYLGLRPFLAVAGLGPNGWAATAAVEAPPPRPAPGAEGAPGFLKAAGSFLSAWRPSRSSFTLPARADQAPAPSAASDARSASGPAKVVGWSQRSSDPAVSRSEGEVTLAVIPATRGSATARATRGFQSGQHCFGVRMVAGADGSVGLVSSEWTPASANALPLGRAQHSWAVASDGSVWSAGRELERLPTTFREGSCVVFVLQLPAPPGLRTATAYVDGQLFEHVFTGLPDTMYPAASNLQRSAQFRLLCDRPLEDMLSSESEQASQPVS